MGRVFGGRCDFASPKILRHVGKTAQVRDLMVRFLLGDQFLQLRHGVDVCR